MSIPKKSLKERIKRLIYLEPYSINRIRLILHNAISKLKLMVAHEMPTLNDIRTEIWNYEEKINVKVLRRIWNECIRNKTKCRDKNIENKIKIHWTILKKSKSWVIKSS